jgi:acetoin utilization deacetylase AcuC-like enzyme
VSSHRLALVDDARFDAHEEAGHPERPERLMAARKGVASASAGERLLHVPARIASDEELTAVHDPALVSGLRRALARGHGHLDPDTYFCPATEEAAWLAAGGTVDAMRTLMADETRVGLALPRPPGHHAEPSRPMGFCLLNNVAVGAAAALAAGAKKVAIVDWDVHHGNGTQAVFERDPRVLFVSLHQYPFYPGTGSSDEIGQGDGRGTTCNVPLPAAQGPESYAHAFRRVVLPLLDGFGADLVLVSAGYDAHARDPLGGMRLDAASYGAMTTALLDHVQRVGHGRLLLLLEGGYDLDALEHSHAAVVRALLGQRFELPEAPPPEPARLAVERTRAALAPFARFEDEASVR